MSDSFYGLSNIYSLTAQIDALKKAKNAGSSASSASQVDPKNYIYEMEKTFSQMLDNLMGPSDEEKEKESSDDIFSSIMTSQQNQLDLLNSKNQGLSSSTGTNTLP
jgi:hypothetical protein